VEGDWDEKTQTMTLIGTDKGPSGNEVKTKMVVTYNKDGSRTFTMYAIMNGKEMKMMECHYTRVDDKPAKSGEQKEVLLQKKFWPHSIVVMNRYLLQQLV